MTKSPVISMTIPNDSQFVAIVRLAISGVAARMNFNVDEIEDIKVAVSEAVSNSIQYAYPEGQAGMIEIQAGLHPDRLEIIVQDDGTGFDQTKKPKTDSLGMGLTFMRCLMDDVVLESEKGKGTQIKMIKKAPATISQ